MIWPGWVGSRVKSSDPVPSLAPTVKSCWDIAPPPTDICFQRRLRLFPNDLKHARNCTKWFKILKFCLQPAASRTRWELTTLHRASYRLGRGNTFPYPVSLAFSASQVASRAFGTSFILASTGWLLGWSLTALSTQFRS